MNVYESDKALHEYLLFHYGAPEDILPWPTGPRAALEYPARCVTECLDLASLPAAPRALDAGCAVGRAAFELARFCTEVVAFDYSERFIDVARRLASGERLSFQRLEEGNISTPCHAQAPPGIDVDRVRFLRADAHAIPAELGRFDVVLAANLIDRLARPRQFLAQLPGLVAPGGQLILTSPYTWLPEFTPVEEWVGGSSTAAGPRNTLEGLREALHGTFTLVKTEDLPFLIREHARKYQWSVAQATIWRRTHQQ